MREINFHELSEKDLKEKIIKIREDYDIELKKATSELPKSFWETYSSFCNTEGGYIILGVEEGTPDNKILGVNNPTNLLTNLWNQLSNLNKVSFRNVYNQDVQSFKIDNLVVIIVKVKEVLDRDKPVYIDNKIENAWIRTGDGDRKIKKAELQAFLRNAQPEQDNLPASNFSIEDLDRDAIFAFKEQVDKRYPTKHFLDMDDKSFLIEIGAARIDRITNKFEIFRGTLLFLGKYNSIKELFPRYHVDYFNYRGQNPRWTDRVSDDEPSGYEMNIFNFYRIVYEKLKIVLQEPFRLEKETQLRLPAQEFDETIRECLVNCLAHADYIQAYPSTKIEVFDGWFRFVNPGKMLVSKIQFAQGGDSRPRNEIIMKMFRLLGASERQGFGGPLIFKTALTNNYRVPEIETNIERTELKVWNIDLVDSYPELSKDEKNVFRVIVKNNRAESIPSIARKIGLSDYKVRKIISDLENKKLVDKMGKGPSTKYIVSFHNAEFLTQLQMVVDYFQKLLNK